MLRRRAVARSLPLRRKQGGRLLAGSEARVWRTVATAEVEVGAAMARLMPYRRRKGEAESWQARGWQQKSGRRRAVAKSVL